MSAVLSRFQKFVAPQPSSCWHWTGAKNAKGYGRFYLDGNKHAHRVAYELHKGPITPGLVLDHLCRNPACVNPDHLEPVTLAENVKRGDHVGKGWKRHITHCPQGHEYTPENTYLEHKADGKTKRHCKACQSHRKGEQS